MRKVISHILLPVTVLFFSCNRHQELAPVAYMQYMEATGNEYKKEIVAGATTYSIQLVPPEYMSLKELYAPNGQVNKEAVLKRVEELNGYLFFLINITKREDEKNVVEKNLSRKAENDQMMSYYSAAANDLTLTDGEISLKPATYQFEDNYGLSPYNTIVVAFRLMKLNKNGLQLVFNDRFAGNPFIKAGFSKKMIEQLPSLNFNK
jgi:hypothetical protein